MKHASSDQGGQYKTGGGRAHFVLIVCTLLYIINYMDRQVFSVILQPMKIDLGLTDAQCGLASTILIFGMAFFSFPIAYLIDRWSRRKAIGLMAILWSIATFTTGLAKNFTGVLSPRFFVGLGLNNDRDLTADNLKTGIVQGSHDRMGHRIFLDRILDTIKPAAVLE